MPKLIGYESTQAAPVAGAVTAGGAGVFAQAAGAGITKIADALIERRKENEASKLAADFAKAQAELTIKQEEAFRAADPNDDQVGRRFMDEQVTPLLESIGSSLETREGRMMYERARNGLVASFSINTAAKQANQSGAAAVQNHLTTKNMLASSVRANPGNYEASLGLAELSFEGETRIDGETRSKLLASMQKDVASAAVYGLADKGQFDQADALIAGTELDAYLDAADKEALQANVRSARNAAASDALSAQRLQQLQAERASEAKRTQYMGTIVGPTGAPTLTADFFSTVLRDPTLVEADRIVLYNVGRSLQSDMESKKATGINSANLQELMQRSVLPDNDPNKLTVLELSSYVQSTDDMAAFNFLANAIQGKDSPEKQVENQLISSAQKTAAVIVGGEVNIVTGERDELNSSAVHAFNSWFMTEFPRRVKAGAEPFSLLTPGSKEYMLSPEILNNFKPTPDEQLGAFVRRMQTKVEFFKRPTTAERVKAITGGK